MAHASTPATTAGQEPAEAADSVLHLLPDSHAHPQLDVHQLEARVAALRVPRVAAMGVAANVDWGGVARLAAVAGSDKIIPGFGIHP